MPMDHVGTLAGRRGFGLVSMCAAFAFVVAPGVMAQQPCNRALDGSYCASAGIKSRPDQPSTNPRPDIGFSGIGSAGFYEQPATLGAVTFGSSGRCIGLVRRVNCRD